VFANATGHLQARGDIAAPAIYLVRREHPAVQMAIRDLNAAKITHCAIHLWPIVCHHRASKQLVDGGAFDLPPLAFSFVRSEQNPWLCVELLSVSCDLEAQIRLKRNRQSGFLPRRSGRLARSR
jgi:hypothetical protein